MWDGIFPGYHVQFIWAVTEMAVSSYRLRCIALLLSVPILSVQSDGNLEVTLLSYYDIDRRLPPSVGGKRDCCSPSQFQYNAPQPDICPGSCNNTLVPCYPQFSPEGPNCVREATALGPPPFSTEPAGPNRDGSTAGLIVQSRYFSNSKIILPFPGVLKPQFIFAIHVYQSQTRKLLGEFHWNETNALTLTTRYANVALSDEPVTRWLALRLHLECAEYYFDNICSTYCKPTDDSEGHFTCETNGTKKCLEGYIDPETNCIKFYPYCDSHPCQHNGTCTDALLGFACNCAAGYTGIFCEKQINFCLSKPCQNRGVCSPHFDSFTCICDPGYTGIFCDKQIDFCLSKPCQNGGSCNPGIDKYDCYCLLGFGGTLCQNDFCKPNPCHKGTCHGSLIGFFCDCPYDATGQKCETRLYVCVNNCGSDEHKICVQKDPGDPINYHCVCEKGYVLNADGICVLSKST